MPCTRDRPSALAKICGLTVLDRLPDVRMPPWCRTTCTIARRRQNRRRFGSEVLPQPYHARDPKSPRVSPYHCSGLNCAHSAFAFSTQGARLKAGGDADPLIQDLNRRPWHPHPQCVLQAKKSKRIEPPPFSANRSRRFPGAMADCGTPNPRKPPAGGQWVCTACCGAVVGDIIRARRHGPGRGWPQSGPNWHKHLVDPRQSVAPKASPSALAPDLIVIAARVAFVVDCIVSTRL